MAGWLAKTDPDTYGYPDLERERSTEWDGVHNPLALRYLRQMVPGDAVMIYHSGAERAVVGIGRVASVPHPDPKDERGSWSVRLAAVRRLRTSVPLSALRGEPSLRGFALLRFSRLSVMPVDADQWRTILSYESRASPASASSARARRGGRAPASASPRSDSAARRRR